MNSVWNYKLIWLKSDLSAGLSVFFVALPLCLGIALASGAPIYSGLLSGIVGGLIVSLISGSQLGVSGPAAGLTTLVSASILSLGDYKIFLLSVIIAGFFQILFGLIKWGTIANYFPSSVIKGMLAAIGLILIFKQIPFILGYSQADFWSNLFSNGSPWVIFDHIERGSLLIGCVSLLIIFIFQTSMKRLTKIFPAALAVVVAGVIINQLFLSSSSELRLKTAHLVSLPENIFSDVSFPQIDQIFSSVLIWKDGLLIALIATVETLLSVEAIDKLDKHNRITPVNRELIAQGIGNVTCGLLGALPITAVIVRGSANIDAGAKTKLSAFFHGVFLLIAVSFLPFLLSKIPYASLAAILLITGFNLTKPSLYKNVRKLGLKQFLPFVLTVLVILSTDLLIGIGIGLLISFYFIVQNNFKAEYKVTKTKLRDSEAHFIKLNSNVTFLNKVKLKKCLDLIPEYSTLTIDGSECNFIDYDILEVISEYSNKAHDRHIELKLLGIQKVQVTSLH
jgi:MFS superfamily sulfate permease-like transporter